MIIEPDMLQVLRGERLDPPPIWLMRQAGRYLPEYRELRTKASSFIEFCLTPELAVEATLQPIRRFDFDAAILFADILLLPHALGQKVWFEEGEGPKLEALKTSLDIERLKPECVIETLSPVFETVKALRGELPANKALIGFAGGPWTVATYMLAGRGGDEQEGAKTWMRAEPEAFCRLMDVLTDSTVEYLVAQVQAGAQVLQIFESWAGALSSPDFERFCIEPVWKICAGLQERGVDVPVIGFPRQAGQLLAEYVASTNIDAVSLDSQVDLDWAHHMLPRNLAVQGNLDPQILIEGGPRLEKEVTHICDRLSMRPHVFNLGHGILPQTPPDHVAKLVEMVRVRESEDS